MKQIRWKSSLLAMILFVTMTLASITSMPVKATTEDPSTQNSVEVTLTTEAGVTAVVYDETGAEIQSKGNGVYDLISGGSYQYVATLDEQYHTTAKFTAEDQGIVSVATPERVAGLKNLALYDNSNKTTRNAFEADQPFSSDQYTYTYQVSDALSTCYGQATPADGYKADALFKKQTTSATTDGTQATVNLKYAVDSDLAGSALTNLIKKGAYGNEITIHVHKEENAVTYYQDYELKLVRVLHLDSLALNDGESAVAFTNENGEALAFDRDTKTYYGKIAKAKNKVTLDAHFTNESTASKYDGGYSAVVNGQEYTDLSAVEIPLNTEEAVETIEIQVSHSEKTAVSSSYSIQLSKVDLIPTVFEIQAKTGEEIQPILSVKNELNDAIVTPQNGEYLLMPGVPYTYSVTAYGYLSQKVTGYIPDSGKVSVVMEKVSSTPLEELNAQWPSLRDENNNAVQNIKTPITSENAVLYWANKSDFTGYIGNPILVDGYLYTYDNTNVYKIDPLTGKVAMKSPDQLVAKSSFSLQPPTYGAGMIFVGLSGGRVQAFDAKTLESLWVFQDTLGGQSNSTILYKDGYIYTGFWNSEIKDASYVCISVTDEDPTTGTEEKISSWSYTKAGGFYWSGACHRGDFLLVGTDDGESGYATGHSSILSIDPKTGTVIDELVLPHAGDMRCGITYDCEGASATGDYYFTTKGGYFYRLSVNADGTFGENCLTALRLENGTTNAPMSTSTPTIYNGRAYVGVSGGAQFSAYKGHNISVIDLGSMTTAYSVPTQGYPQTSGLLTTAYSAEQSGKVYVYFFDNYTPGKLRVISDQPGQTSMAESTTENQMETGYVLFTPSGAQAQYALCTPIADETGTLYFKNDSNYLMAVGPTIEKIEVTKQPDKMRYQEGEVFDATGMEVTAYYTNGVQRDITNAVSFSNEPLTADAADFEIRFESVMYQNKDGVAGSEYTAPVANLTLQIGEDVVSDPITCYVRAESTDGTELPMTKVVLNKNQVPAFTSYGIGSAPAETAHITPLHVLLQAMKDRGMTTELSGVQISPEGWINEMFGWGYNQLWVAGGCSPSVSCASYEAKEGDVYTFFEIDSDWMGFGCTAYGFFGEFADGDGNTEKGANETWEKAASVGEEVSLKYLFTAGPFMHNPANGACYDTEGGYVKVYVGKAGAETTTEADYRQDITVKEDGTFTLVFDQPGEYPVTAKYYNANGQLLASNAFCKVSVSASTSTTDSTFTDVEKGSWYEDACEYVNRHKIMTGKREGIFDPMTGITRAEFATIIYRMAGAEKVEKKQIFTDVPMGEWYADAVTWANENGIVTGYGNGIFLPMRMINRQEMATMLKRYADKTDFTWDPAASLESFADYKSVDEFAVEPVKWAVGNQIIKGLYNGTKLEPQKGATRAETAVMIMRFMQKMGIE